MQPDERNILIRVDQKLSDLHENNEKTHERIENKLESMGNELHKRIDDQVQVYPDQIKLCNDTFIRNKVFYWVMGIMVGIVLAYGGMITANKIDIMRLKIQYEIEHHDELPTPPT